MIDIQVNESKDKDKLVINFDIDVISAKLHDSIIGLLNKYDNTMTNKEVVNTFKLLLLQVCESQVDTFEKHYDEKTQEEFR